VNKNKDTIKLDYQRQCNDIVQYVFGYDKAKDKFTACKKTVGMNTSSICSESIGEEIRTIIRDIRTNGKVK
jgi:hypothetical protein